MAYFVYLSLFSALEIEGTTDPSKRQPDILLIGRMKGNTKTTNKRMGIFSINKKKAPMDCDKPTGAAESVKSEATSQPTVNNEQEKTAMDKVAPKNIGKLDMVIAFDTTGSMAAYIEDVRKQVAELVPGLFKDNEDLRLGIVAFGDYCDMKGPNEFGIAYQCLPLTDNENEIIRFIRDSENTSGGDGDEFYELVIKKIVEETKWREGSTRSILLIADAEPHPIGYSYENIVSRNSIDWKKEAEKAAGKKIKIDTVTIINLQWFKELSAMTNGISIPFCSYDKTGDLIMASTMARGSMKARAKFDELNESCKDEEMKKVYACFFKERNNL
jgi:hypothetical protein